MKIISNIEGIKIPKLVDNELSALEILNKTNNTRFQVVTAAMINIHIDIFLLRNVGAYLPVDTAKKKLYHQSERF
jgi:hypothetical protein